MAMMTTKGGHSYQPMSEINVTPFVDVMLVLLVIFMVTAPMMVQGLDVKLPEAEAKPMEQADDKLILTLTKDERVMLGDAEIPIARLAEVLGTNAKIKKDKEIFLQADDGLRHGFVVKVMALARQGGAESIGIMTDPKGQGE